MYLYLYIMDSTTKSQEERSCQEIITTLLRANESYDPTMFVKALSVVTPSEASKCSHLGLKEVFARYVNHIGDKEMKNVLSYEETCRDMQKVRSANLFIGYEFCRKLCTERTWDTWFFS